MASDERNFRSIYYDKVGFRSCEEKKSLEILLKEKPLDCQRLKQFSLRFPVPSAYRILLWKYLMSITPTFCENYNFVWGQRVETYEDLLRTARTLQLVIETTPKAQVNVLLFLLEIGELKFDISSQMQEPINKGFLAISESCLEIVDGDVERYWIARGFFGFVNSYVKSIPRLTEAFHILLEKEDPELFRHLVGSGTLDVNVIHGWFFSLFANIIHESAIVKIWDKLCGGTSKLLVFVGVQMLMTLRRSLLAAKSSEAVLAELTPISDETSDVISNKAIELWQKHGSPLHCGSQDRREER